MSLISRLRQHFPSGIFPNPYFSSIITSKTLNPNSIHRTYAQPALQQQEEEDDEFEEVEIDPRKLPADYDPSNFDPTAHRSPPSDRVFRLVDEVSSLKLLEAAELGSILMKKMGIKEDEPPVIGVLNPGAAAGLAQMAAKSGAGDGGEVEEVKKEEKSVFELKLESFEAASKLKVIKEIRGFTELGLKEAKDLVEKTPSIFKRGVPKDEAQQIIEKMKAAGANVIME